MFKNQDVAYSPYGAYELKASYQRNMLTCSLLVNGLIVIASLIIVVLVNSQDIKEVLPVPIRIIKEMPPRQSIITDPAIVDVISPKTPPPAHDEVIPTDDDALIADSIEIENIENDATDSTSQEGQATGQNIGPVTYEDDGLMPGIDQFVPVERLPEFIHKSNPDYPRFDRMAGIEGTVWIAAKVDIDGSVSDAKIYKTSGRKSLDQAALDSAFKNKFRPAIQNGNPIKLWVAYKVEFVLNQ